jgi:ATP-dependent RNA helicase DDX52/ROK1
MALTRETASGTLGERVSAAADAASLMRAKSSKKRKAGQADGVKQDDANDDILHWTDEEDDEAALVAAEPSAAGASLVLPSLPKCDVLVVTPLIFVAVLRHAKRQAPQSEPLLASVRHVVLDEVDNLLDLGFIEQVDEILSALPTTELLERLAAQLPPVEAAAVAAAAPLCHVQRAMLTATLPSGVEELAMTVLRDPVRASVGVRGATVSTVEQRLVFVGKERGKAVALKQMLTDGISPPVLVFAQSKDRVEQVSRLLQLEGASSVDVIHADRSPAQRDEAVTDFRRGKTMFLVTTDVLGRGIDFKGVNVVINFDFPTSAVSYVHRIGRTGRAGRAGLAVTFFTEDDIPLLRSIANVMRLSGCDVPAWQLTLKKISRKEKGRVPKRKNVAAATKNGGAKKK